MVRYYLIKMENGEEIKVKWSPSHIVNGFEMGWFGLRNAGDDQLQLSILPSPDRYLNVCGARLRIVFVEEISDEFD